MGFDSNDRIRRALQCQQKESSMSESGLSAVIDPKDDDLHDPVSDDMHWSETHWFSFDQPGSNLSATIYPVLRKNMSLASLAVYLWDGSASEPWRVRYAKAYWHLPFPDDGFQRLRLGDLKYDCIEPFRAWKVQYRDGRQVQMNLRWDALRSPHFVIRTDAKGHFDQPCRVTGEVVLDGVHHAIDTLGMRDKSWGVRSDLRVGEPASSEQTAIAYTYGHSGADEQFLLYSAMHGNVGGMLPGGYLVRKGQAAGIAASTRRVLGRRNGHVTLLELEITDALGRELRLTGICRNRLAHYALSTTFAFLSMTEWRTVEGERFLGEDQEVFSPYYTGPRLALLNTESG